VFGYVQPYLYNVAVRDVTFLKGDVWIPERWPHSNVLVWPGLGGGVHLNNKSMGHKLMNIRDAYDFTMVRTLRLLVQMCVSALSISIS